MSPNPVAVIGAGPAGLTAAIELASARLPVILIDAGERPGGQYWRQAAWPLQTAPDETSAGSGPSPGSGSGAAAGSRGDRQAGRLLRRLAGLRREGLIDYRAGREAWLISTEDDAFRIELRPTVSVASARESVRAERLVLCPGGQDRQLPVPGWDLPGVYAAGGLQALLKGQRTLAGRRVAVAGTGPFLLPVATGLARAGAEVITVCEAKAPTGWIRSARTVAGAPGKIIEGAGYAAQLIRHRIPYRTRTIIGEIRGDHRVESVRLDKIDRSGRLVRAGVAELEVDAVGLGWGFTPALELIMMVGAATEAAADGSLVAVVDAGQRAGVRGVYVAGEACGVGGAELARAEGELAARTLLADRAGAARRPAPAALRRRIRRLRAFAAAMHRAHPVPPGWPDWCRPDTVLCRCEEVTVGALEQAAAELGARSARDQKLFTRCGMGWCQGRICGPAVAGLAARLAGRTVTADDLRAMAKRTLATPVPLGELARLADPDPPTGTDRLRK